MGSLAGAAHLLNNNTDDLRLVQCERKSHVEFKGKIIFLTLVFNMSQGTERCGDISQH